MLLILDLNCMKPIYLEYINMQAKYSETYSYIFTDNDTFTKLFLVFNF